MIFDHSAIFSFHQAITATAASTNIIDLGPVGTAHGHAAPLKRDLGTAACIPLLIQATEDFAAAGDATLTIALQVDDNAGFASPKTVATFGPIAVADLKAGKYAANYDFVPKGVDERYMRLNYTVATGPFTAGEITAGIVGAVQNNPLV